MTSIASPTFWCDAIVTRSGTSASSKRFERSTCSTVGVGAQEGDLLLAHLVGHDEDAAVALDRRADREADAGVPGGGLDDRAARPELPLALRGLDHRQADPIPDGAAGIQVLELREQRRLDARAQLLEADDRGRAHEVEDRRILRS